MKKMGRTVFGVRMGLRRQLPLLRWYSFMYLLPCF
jgi:hypothetical protein